MSLWVEGIQYTTFEQASGAAHIHAEDMLRSIPIFISNKKQINSYYKLLASSHSAPNNEQLFDLKPIAIARPTRKAKSKIGQSNALPSLI